MRTETRTLARLSTAIATHGANNGREYYLKWLGLAATLVFVSQDETFRSRKGTFYLAEYRVVPEDRNVPEWWFGHLGTAPPQPGPPPAVATLIFRISSRELKTSLTAEPINQRGGPGRGGAVL